MVSYKLEYCCVIKIEIINTLKNEITISNPIIFFNKRNPKIITMGTMYILPTHQLATCTDNSPAIRIPIATGLNICFFFIVKRYFEPIAIKDAKKANHKKLKSKIDLDGVMTNDNIRAVIYTDSIFTGALNIFENNLFVAHENKVMYATEMTI